MEFHIDTIMGYQLVMGADIDYLFPLSMTTILSELMIVESLCAMTMVVVLSLVFLAPSEQPCLGDVIQRRSRLIENQ